MKTEMTEKQMTELLKAAIQTDSGRKVFLDTLNKLFEDGTWEIPDDAIAGVVTNKVNQLDAQVKSLTSLVAALSSKVDGEPATTGKGRVDVLAKKNRK